MTFKERLNNSYEWLGIGFCVGLGFWGSLGVIALIAKAFGA